MLKSINRRLVAKVGKIEHEKDPSLHATEVATYLVGGHIDAVYDKTKKEITFSSRSSETRASILLQSHEIRSILRERGVRVKSIKVY